MASARSGRGSKGSKGQNGELDVGELSARLAALEMENKTLRRRLHSTSGSSGEAGKRAPSSLTPSQKEAMIVAATSRLTGLAVKKIDAKIRAATASAQTKVEMEEALATLSFRVELSWSATSDRAPARKSRSGSKTRVDKA